MKRFIFRPDNRQQILQVISNYLSAQGDAALPLEVVVKPYKAKRSLMQNARLHKIIGECSKESGYSIAEMKMEFKKELLPPVAWFDYKGHKCPLYQSTADMNVSELNAFMEGVENLASSWYSVTLPFDEVRYEDERYT